MLIAIFVTIIISIISAVYSPLITGFLVFIFGLILYLYKKKVYAFFFVLSFIFLIYFIYTSLIINSKQADYEIIRDMQTSVRFLGKVSSISNYGFLYQITEDPFMKGKEVMVYKRNHQLIPGDIVKVDGNLILEEEITRLDYLTQPLARVLPRQIIKTKDSRLKWIFDFKRILIVNVQKHLPEYYANFLVGLLIGVNGIELDNDLQEVFLNLGLLHMLVVSGAQVALLTSVLLRLLTVFHLPKTGNFIIVLIFNSIFLLFVGGDISVLRAVIMMQITIFLNYDNRAKTSLQVLSFTGVIMLSLSPGMLFNLGFILSFCATYAVVEISPKIGEMLESNQHTPEFLKEPLSVSLGPIMTTSPIIFLINRRFDVLALFANMLFGPIVEVVVIIGFIGMLSSVLISFLAYPILQFTFGLMVIMKTVADILYVFPLRSVYFRNAFFFNVAIYYVFFLTWIYQKDLFRKHWQSWVTLIIICLVINYWFFLQQPDREIYFYNKKDWFTVLYINKNGSLLLLSEENVDNQKLFTKKTFQLQPSVIIVLKATEDCDNKVALNRNGVISWGEVQVAREEDVIVIMDNYLKVNIALSNFIPQQTEGILYLPYMNRTTNRITDIKADLIIASVKQSQGQIISGKNKIAKIYTKNSKYFLESIR